MLYDSADFPNLNAGNHRDIISTPDDRYNCIAWAARHIWEVQTGREVLCLNRHAAGINALAYIADTNRVATASRDQTVRLWDLRSGLEVEQLDAQAGNVLDIAVSADGKRLAAAHFDTVLRIWDIESAAKSANA